MDPATFQAHVACEAIKFHLLEFTDVRVLCEELKQCRVEDLAVHNVEI